jgi:aminoglycoside 3-N-acetyltransferase
MISGDAYVPYKQIANQLPLHKGDILYVISDILEIAKVCRDHGERFECEGFIESLQEAVGEGGTLLFPVFSWDFCQGIAFDYHKTRSKAGALGNAALRMPDFRRTQHPLYSFAVWGQERDYLCSLEDISSFGEESPFAYLRERRASSLVIGLTALKGNTFILHIEQTVGVTYRYEKEFTADYIDASGHASEKTYSMYVRDLALSARYDPRAMEAIIDQLGINKAYNVNGIPYHLTDLYGLYEAGRLDILYNQARNLYHY